MADSGPAAGSGPSLNSRSLSGNRVGGLEQDARASLLYGPGKGYGWQTTEARYGSETFVADRLKLSSRWLPKEVVKEHWGDWLSQWRWDWWVTLTFDQKRVGSATSTHTGAGWSLSDRYWYEWLAWAVPNASPYWVRAREPNKSHYGTHFHALVGAVPTATRRTAAFGEWKRRHGVARIEPYDPLQGAGYYVSKYVVKQLGDIQFSANFAEERQR
jgi:hypothetical protein